MRVHKPFVPLLPRAHRGGALLRRLGRDGATDGSGLRALREFLRYGPFRALEASVPIDSIDVAQCAYGTPVGSRLL